MSGDEVAFKSGFETHHSPVLATRGQAGNAPPVSRNLADAHNAIARNFIAPPVCNFANSSRRLLFSVATSLVNLGCSSAATVALSLGNVMDLR